MNRFVVANLFDHPARDVHFSSGYTGHRDVSRHVSDYHSAGGNQAAFANRAPLNDGGTGANKGILTYPDGSRKGCPGSYVHMSGEHAVLTPGGARVHAAARSDSRSGLHNGAGHDLSPLLQNDPCSQYDGWVDDLLESIAQ